MQSYLEFTEVIDTVDYQTVDYQTVVERYFATLNQAAFAETASLFTESGILFPPFDQPVVGPAAILKYLQAEAQGMQVEPIQFQFTHLTDDQIQADVTGQVQTVLFKVNVAWNFGLNSQAQIEFVRVNLLASLQELLHLRSE